MTIRIDNRMLVDVGRNAHSVSDHTQTNWNGFIGRIQIEKNYIDHVVITPNIQNKSIKANITFPDAAKQNFTVFLQVKDLEGNTIGSAVT